MKSIWREASTRRNRSSTRPPPSRRAASSGRWRRAVASSRWRWPSAIPRRAPAPSRPRAAPSSSPATGAVTQGLAMGLGGPVSAADLDAVEAQLRPRPNRREAPGRGSVEPWRDRPHGHGARQMELTPFAHPSLAAELARRGYRVHEWQLVWTRGVPAVRPAGHPPRREAIPGRAAPHQASHFPLPSLPAPR